MNMHGIWEMKKNMMGKGNGNLLEMLFLKRKSPNFCGIWEMTGIIEKLFPLRFGIPKNRECPGLYPTPKPAN